MNTVDLALAVISSPFGTRFSLNAQEIATVLLVKYGVEVDQPTIESALESLKASGKITRTHRGWSAVGQRVAA
jgi:hypothetical protein